MAGSDGPLLEVVQLGPLAMNTKVFSAIALFALVNGALINMVMASRLLYGMARAARDPALVRRASTRAAGRRGRAIVLSGSLAAVLVVVGDLETLADTTVLLLLFAFVAVHISVLVLRRTPVDHEHFRAWTGFPVLGGAVLRRPDRAEARRGRDRVRLRRRPAGGRPRAVAAQLSSVASTVMLLTPASAREMMQPSLAVFAAS